ncbi:MAG: tetratricopeptide repeat protein, partial [Candidatus Hinthialibacter sp.]
DALYFNKTAMGDDWVIPAALGLGVLLLILETGCARKKDDLRFPSGVCLLILSGLSFGMSYRPWLIHPLTWIALACLQNAHRKETGDLPELRPSLLKKDWTPWAIAGFAGFLTLFSLSNLYPHWQTEKAIRHFAQSLQNGDRSDDLIRAFRNTPYRGDVAALYSTESIMTFYPQGILPASPEPAKLESFMNLGAKYGFVPLLGYARLSGLYFLHSQGELSLSALRDAVRYAPDEPALREMLADTLDTLGLKEQALQQYKICANLHPALPRIRKKMALIYMALGRQDEALRERNNLLTLDPSRQPPPD